MTIFIIVAILLVAGIVGFFLLRDRFVHQMPAEFKQVEIYYENCINDRALAGKEILSEKGGYIYNPEFEAGSNYAPFSSELNFQGIGVPYWYYVSGNNFVKEQVPSQQKMEQQLKTYLEEEIKTCDFSDFEAKGFIINVSNPQVTARISDELIEITVNSDLIIQKGSQVESQSSRIVSLKSKLGKFYKNAVNIYNYENKNSFLEQYAVDVLRLYAPVDGVEISCSPKIWISQKVVDDVKQGLEANIQAIKLKGDYYTLKNDKNKYFVTNLATDSPVNFIYSQNWSSRFEIWPAESLMVAQPVGNQEGMGIMGFCYVPYHFVYDAMFPVMVQVYEGEEFFQFPVAVVISKNMPRNSLPGEEVVGVTEDICKNKNTPVSVYTYDSKLNPVEADISFKCFETECTIGKTKIEGDNAILTENFPQCVNGFIIAKADGYTEKKYMISTNQEGIADIVLDKLYDVELGVRIDGKDSGGYALVYFNGEDYSTTVAWPDQSSVKLTEGIYNITAYVYGNSTLVFPASTTQKCVEVPASGLLGSLFGQTDEKCFDINVPQQVITSVLMGGGKTQDVFTEDMLVKKMIIDTSSLPSPTGLEQIQKNYDLFETKYITIKNE